jgi:hypothetical protein
MVRFRCIHCKGRLAVHGRHMGRLARCPECGGVTHPLNRPRLRQLRPAAGQAGEAAAMGRPYGLRPLPSDAGG